MHRYLKYFKNPDTEQTTILHKCLSWLKLILIICYSRWCELVGDERRTRGPRSECWKTSSQLSPKAYSPTDYECCWRCCSGRNSQSLYRVCELTASVWAALCERMSRSAFTIQTRSLSTRRAWVNASVWVNWLSVCADWPLLTQPRDHSHRKNNKVTKQIICWQSDSFIFYCVCWVPRLPLWTIISPPVLRFTELLLSCTWLCVFGLWTALTTQKYFLCERV